MKQASMILFIFVAVVLTARYLRHPSPVVDDQTVFNESPGAQTKSVQREKGQFNLGQKKLEQKKLLASSAPHDQPHFAQRKLEQNEAVNTDLKSKYPQIKEVLSIMPMTQARWNEKWQGMPSAARTLAENGPMPLMELSTSDNEPTVSSSDLKPTTDCQALNSISGPVTISLNEKGQIQDAMNTANPTDQKAIPQDIYGCTFQPHVVQGVTTSVIATFYPNLNSR